MSKCECCMRQGEIAGVASSSLGPLSLAYCRECLDAGAEPKWLIENTIVCCSGRSHMSAGWDSAIQFFENDAYHPASEIDVTPEKIAQFWKDFSTAMESRAC